MFSRQSFLVGVSVLALSIPAPGAFAQNNADTPDMPEIIAEKLQKDVKKGAKELQKDVKQGWDVTKKAASETADAAEDLAEGAVITIREAIIDRESAVTGIHTINYHPRRTANSIIGSPVYNSSADIVGNVEDILVDKIGKATHFVVGDGSVISFGDKKVAFEYDRIADKSSTGAIVAPISDDLIDLREAYDPAKHQGFSLRKMLDGEVLAASGKTVASIDNIVITNGYATHVVAGFGKILGMGGEQVALAYGTGAIAVQDDEIDIVLSNAQSINFEAFQNAVTN